MITVFTPVYNRIDIISKLYESLTKQTSKNFEWIVVDDGSEDDIKQLFEKWISSEKNFEIKYIYQNNGGKHRAINKGLDFARGNLFFIVDSDDFLTSDAIEKIVYFESTIKNKSCFAGVSGLKAYNSDNIVGSTFDGEFVDATSLERDKYGINGDKSEVFYTDILKKYKFPEYDNEKFITESVVYNRIANDGYKIRWFNEIIYFCEYREDGLTSQGRQPFINNPKGYATSVKETIIFKKLKFKQKYDLAYYYYLDLKNMFKLKDIANQINVSVIFLKLVVIKMNIKQKLFNMIKK